MTAGAKGLGRGLGALIRDMAPPAPGREGVTELPILAVLPNPSQPRQRFSPETLRELAQSIAEQGVLQPILVRPAKEQDRYELVAGERRLRASKLAGLTTIPALVRAVTDEQSALIGLVENLQREDLGPIEEASALRRLQEGLDITQEELAARVGKSRSAVANALRLLNLSPRIQEGLQSGACSSGHARALLAVTDAPARERLYDMIGARGLNVRQVEELVAVWKQYGAFAPPRKTLASTEFGRTLRKSLSARISLPHTFSGSPEQGSLTLRYTSADQLNELLSLLGMKSDD